MCNKVVRMDPWLLNNVPDWFVTQEEVKLWHDDNDFYDDDEIIEWYDGYQKRKAQKAKIEKEIMRIAWHPSCRWDWCLDVNKKKQTEKLWK